MRGKKPMYNKKRTREYSENVFNEESDRLAKVQEFLQSEHDRCENEPIRIRLEMIDVLLEDVIHIIQSSYIYTE